MKVKADEIARAVDAPNGKARLYLLYGPDESASRALASRLERAIGPDVERIDLDGTTLKEDPARLADEAAAISLFGGRRLIRVTGGDECAAAVKALLESPTTGDPVVLVAGALKPSSTLLGVALTDAHVVAFQSYKPEGGRADDLAIAIGRGFGLRIGRDVAHRLAVGALGDRAVLERELEKIALYLDAAPDRPREATVAVIDAIGADLGEPDASALIDAALDGRLDAVAAELATADGAAAGPIPMLRALARRLLLLARLRAEVEQGARVADVMARQGRAIFYKEQDAVARQLSRWSAERLAIAASRVFEAEAALKRSGTVGDVIAAAEMVAIARAAARRR